MLVAKDSSLGSFMQSSVSTDIELYNEATALATARREVFKSQTNSKSFNLPPSLMDKLNNILAATGHKIERPAPSDRIHKRKRNLCVEKTKKPDLPQNLNDSEKANDGSPSENQKENSENCETIGDRRQRKFSEIQRLKSSCKSEEIHKLRGRCEQLMRMCIAGALVKLSNEEFKNMEGKKVAENLNLSKFKNDLFL